MIPVKPAEEDAITGVFVLLALFAIPVLFREDCRVLRLWLSWHFRRRWRRWWEIETHTAGTLAMATGQRFYKVEHDATWKSRGYFSRRVSHHDDAALAKHLVAYKTGGWMARRRALRFLMAVLRVKAQSGRLSDLTSSPSKVVKLWVAALAIGVRSDDKSGSMSPLADLRHSDFRRGIIVYSLPSMAVATEPFAKRADYFEALLGKPILIMPVERLPGAVCVRRLPLLPAVIKFGKVASWRARIGIDKIVLGVDMITAEPVFMPVADFHNFVIGGTAGFGKSVFLHQILGQLIEQPETAVERIIAVDLKGGVEFDHYRETNPRLQTYWHFDDVVAVVNDLVAVMYHRLHEMKNAGDNKWQHGKIFLIVDEYAQIVLTSKIHDWVNEKGEPDKTRRAIFENNLFRLSMLGRAAGIVIIVAAQKPTDDAIPAPFRANMQGQICFRVASLQIASLLLGINADKLLFDPVNMARGECIINDPMTGMIRYLRVMVTDSAMRHAERKVA